MRVAIVHDYLTQRGGAERVVLSMLRAFPEAPVYTSLYDPVGTFPEFADVDVRTLALDRVSPLRRHHRLALPLLAPSFGRLVIDADVILCSTSGWAHGARTSGRKLVYCHTPARWLYKRERYAPGGGVALAVLGPWLRAWDERSARSADLYLANSTHTRAAIRDVYGIDAEVLHPSPALAPAGDERAPAGGVPEGYALCVARLLPYKNVGAVVDAFRALRTPLVVVGEGPELAPLRATAPANVVLLGRVDDAELRWLYGHATAVVAASYEDFGLTPLEGARFGVPAAVLGAGGFLDTVADGTTGVHFREPSPSAIAEAVRRLHGRTWSAAAIRAHAERFDERRFIERLQALTGVYRPQGLPADPPNGGSFTGFKPDI